MHPDDVQQATQAAMSIAAQLGLPAHDAVVLHNSNALTLRLGPCDVLARVEPSAHQSAELQVGIARRLAEAGSPVAELVSPEVFVRGGHVITLWTYYEPVTPRPAGAAYAGALALLHAGMRTVNVPTPHVNDRVTEAETLVADRTLTPELTERDRAFLAGTLARMRRAVAGSGRPEQLLHGEPHPGNVLPTRSGPLFIDFETCCRGPVEFDLAHAPDEVAGHYPGIDRQLLRDCRTLALAMNTAWRWDRDDEFPDGHRLGNAWLTDLRAIDQPQ